MTLVLDDDLLAEAQRLTGTTEKTALVRQGLQALIERESARRIARLGGQRAGSAGHAEAQDPAGPRHVILVDTSVWVDHLRSGDTRLAAMLEHGAVLGHPWVVGELALGQLAHGTEVLHLLRSLPQAERASDTELALLVEQHRLFGRGIGYVDVALLASVRLTPDARLWTRDRKLAAVATELDVAAS